MGKTPRKNRRFVLRHGRSREKKCVEIFLHWQNKKAEQLYNEVRVWASFGTRVTSIRKRREPWTAHLTRHIFSCFTAHILMSHWHWLKFGVCRALHFIPSSCAHDVCCLILYDSPLYSLLSIFSLIFLFILLFFTFFFHDVVDKYPAQTREWGPWHPCWERSSSSMMWWTSTLRTLANEDLGTFSENDPLTTNAWLAGFLALITRVTTDNIPMCVIRRSIVDWDCSKTQTLLEILKILNRLREESYVSSEVEHSFPQVGRVSNKLSAPQNLKLSLWMLDFAWTGYPRLIFGSW